MVNMDQLEEIYRKHCTGGTAIAAHLPRLRALAKGLEVAAEFGVKRGASSAALLLGAASVYSYDIVATPDALAIKALVGERWHYQIGDSRTADVPSCDLLFVDSAHDYEHVKAELSAHADKARRYLVFHDVLTFGSVGARGESGDQLWAYKRGVSVPRECLGIRPAIDELMIRDPSWHIAASYTDSHGLLVLERR